MPDKPKAGLEPSQSDTSPACTEHGRRLRSKQVRLHTALVGAADRHCLLDISYQSSTRQSATCSSPRLSGDCRELAYQCEDHAAVLVTLGQLVSPRILGGFNRSSQARPCSANSCHSGVLVPGSPCVVRNFTEAMATTMAITSSGTAGASVCAWLSIQSPTDAPSAMATT